MRNKIFKIIKKTAECHYDDDWGTCWMDNPQKVANAVLEEIIKIIENRICLLANVSSISEMKFADLPFDIRITIIELNKILEIIKK